MMLSRATVFPSDAKTLRTRIARSVRDGLTRTPKRLPSWLFYDDAGSALYEQITTLPEYYLTRAEAEIFRMHGDTIAWVAGEGSRIALAELGAGTATKTEILLRAIVARQLSCTYLACDISHAVLRELEGRMAARFSAVSG